MVSPLTRRGSAICLPVPGSPSAVVTGTRAARGFRRRVKEFLRDDRDDLTRAIGLVPDLAGQLAAAAQNQVDAAGTGAQRKAQAARSRCRYFAGASPQPA